jgi:DNA-binding response OmpR family regulator
LGLWLYSNTFRGYCFEEVSSECAGEFRRTERRTMRILLVEDEPEMARLVSSLVSNAGFGVDHVGTLSEAMEVVRQIPYDLVLLDRRLPDGDGMTLVSSVRRCNPGIRVVMLTARDAIEDLVKRARLWRR